LLVCGCACQPVALNGTASTARTASAARTPVEGGTFTEAIVGSVGTLSPLYAEEDNAREISALIYEGLTRTGPDQQPEPVLARQIQVSGDGLTYSVFLRTDARFADGVAFSADDVVFTYAALQDPTYTGPGASNWKGVTIRKVASDRVDFSLRSPSAGFPASLRIGILPRHLFTGTDAASISASPFSGPKALGTGPFMVDSISADRMTVRLKRNPNARHAARLQSIIFRGYGRLAEAASAVGRGDADGVGSLDSPELVALGREPGVHLLDARSFTFVALLFDESAGSPFASAAVRRAFAQAIDRRSLIAGVLSGRADAQNTCLPASDWAYSQTAADKYPYDVGGAGKILDDAGWTLAPQALVRTHGSTELSVEVMAADIYPYRELAQELRRQLTVLGARVTVKLVPAADLASRNLATRNYQSVLASFDNGPDPDQFAFWHSSNRGYALNFSTLPKQSFIDKDLEDGRSRLDRTARLGAYDDLQLLLADAAPAAFLYEPHYLYAVNDRVGGVRLDATVGPPDRFDYVSDWYLTR
jgi:peptide/nickel transport system substrate-binding protein